MSFFYLWLFLSYLICNQIYSWIIELFQVLSVAWCSLIGYYKMELEVSHIVDNLNEFPYPVPGSEGKLSSPYQRDGIINSIYALSSAPTGRTLNQLAASICLFLMSYYKEEGIYVLNKLVMIVSWSLTCYWPNWAGNEEVRISVLSALGVWISRAADLIPDSATTFFLAGLKEKENLKRFHLRSLRLGFKNSSFCMKVFVGGISVLVLGLYICGVFKLFHICRCVHCWNHFLHSAKIW